MRKLTWILLAIIALQACEQNSETYNIEVNLDGTEGKWVRLMARVDREYVTYDSAFAEAGNPAVLTRGIEGVNSMYLTVDDVEGNILLLVDNSNYEVSGNMEEPEIKTDSKAQNDLNDYNEQIRVMELLTELNHRGHTLIIITHSMWVVAEYAHRVVVLSKGKILADDTTRKVFSNEVALRESALKLPEIVQLGLKFNKTILSLKEFKFCMLQGIERNNRE